MSISIRSPLNSFVQFFESDAIASCNFADIELCLPVYEDDDVSFQFFLITSNEAEADGLCDIVNARVKVGIVNDCDDDFLMEFAQKPERFRVAPTMVLYNWGHGLPAFASVISRGECFMIKIKVDNAYNFCSNCFQRIAEPCHTSVIEYSNDDNFAGFNYCNSETEVIPGVIEGGECFAKTIIPFTNMLSLSIPYTAQLQTKYGSFPTVRVWLYDEQNVLVDMGIRVTLDSYPPTVIKANMGGNASGILIIS